MSEAVNRALPKVGLRWGRLWYFSLVWNRRFPNHGGETMHQEVQEADVGHLTADEVATRLNVPRWAVYQLARLGEHGEGQVLMIGS